MVPQVGQRIGPYEILGRLGSGGMGLVFSAWDARLFRDVAIKILREEYATMEMRRRFVQEARAASGLNHPNICTIFDIGEQNGDPYLVMELLKGETLRQRMNRRPISVRGAARIGYEVADALSVAHARGIVHRDIKPANVFVVDKPGGGFMSKVLDFGLAKVETYGLDPNLDLTHVGTTVGTVSYMSPEQARGESLDARSDLFSLGVLLYEMVTERLPFQGATSALVFVDLLGKAPAPIRPQNPHVPEDLEYIILKLLEKDRTLRFQNAAQVMEALESVSFGAAGSGRTDLGSEDRRPAAPLQGREAGSTNGDGIRSRPLLQVSQPSAGGQVPARPSGAGEAAKSTEEVLRPVKRVVRPEGAAPVSTGAKNVAGDGAAAPSPEKPVSGSRNAATPEQPAAGSGKEAAAARSSEHAGQGRQKFAVPSRPIVPSSARMTEPPPISLPRVPSAKPTPRFTRMAELDEHGQMLPQMEAAHRLVAEHKAQERMWLLPVAVVVMIAVGVIAWILWPRPVGPSAARPLAVVLAPVANTTSEGPLSGVFTAGMRLELEQSPEVLALGTEAMAAALQSEGVQPGRQASDEDARRAAQALGATEVLFGDVKPNGGAYTVGLRLVSASTGKTLLQKEETAPGRQQIPDALDRLAADVRAATGVNESESAAVVPLSKEATGNVEALEAYAAGVDALSKGRLEDAASALEHATSADPHFAQAYLELARVYKKQHAQLSAASAAVSAQTNAQHASKYTQWLAAAEYALDATDSLVAMQEAINPLLRVYPNSVRGQVDRALMLKEQGRFSESFNAAQIALNRDPYDSEALAVAETDLLGQQRAAAAASMDDAAVQAGRGQPGLRLLAAYLISNEHGPVDTSADPAGRVALGETQAALLDATGAAFEGLKVWQNTAVSAGIHLALFSAAGEALARAGFDRAITGECGNSATVLGQAQNYPLGPEAQFRVGLASASCGDLGTARSSLDTLRRSYPQSFTATTLYGPELTAAIQWKSGKTEDALNTLQAMRQYDNMSVSLALFLRGQIHLAAHEPQEALVDFQYVVQHPGAAVLMDPITIPMAQLGMARAYQMSGDKLNSGIAYGRFLAMWSAADPGSALLAEARANAAR